MNVQTFASKPSFAINSAHICRYCDGLFNSLCSHRDTYTCADGVCVLFWKQVLEKMPIHFLYTSMIKSRQADFLRNAH